MASLTSFSPFVICNHPCPALEDIEVALSELPCRLQRDLPDECLLHLRHGYARLALRDDLPLGGDVAGGGKVDIRRDRGAMTAGIRGK